MGCMGVPASEQNRIMTSTKRCADYLRVSTDRQTVENQVPK